MPSIEQIFVFSEKKYLNGISPQLIRNGRPQIRLRQKRVQQNRIARISVEKRQKDRSGLSRREPGMLQTKNTEPQFCGHVFVKQLRVEALFVFELGDDFFERDVDVVVVAGQSRQQHVAEDFVEKPRSEDDW